MSSFGKLTTVTVVSATISEALRWIASAISTLAFLSAASFASSSLSLIITARSCVNSDCVWSRIWVRACSWLNSAIRSSSVCCLLISEEIACSRSSNCCCRLFKFASRSARLCSLRSSVSSRRSRVSSRWFSRCSDFWTSARRSFNSSSSWVR